MSRWKAAAIHLLISGVIAGTVVFVMYALWYPGRYFLLMGGTLLVALIVGCDVVLGPLVTLIVFKSGKKSLRFDLTCIGIVQTIALGYGLFTMFEARPVFTVFAVDRFEVMTPSDIKLENLHQASAPEFGSFPLTGPKIVGARLPTDPKEREDLLFGHFGGDLANLPRFYVPYDDVAKDVIRKAKPVTALEAKNPSVLPEIVRLSADTPRSQLGYVPVTGRFLDMAALIDTTSGRVLGFVQAAPW